MKSFKSIVVYGGVLLLAACASMPMGPTVRVLPPQGKPFDQFAAEQAGCKQYADSQVSGQADRANTTGLLEGLGGTVLGAGLGAAVGGGQGAAVGAAGGAIAGTAVGASTSMHQQKSIQQQYNDAYAACMTAKGNQIDRPVVYSPPAQTTVIYTQPAPPPTVIYTQPAPAYYPPPPPPPGY
ncbi:MAG: glycine zipper family protein [Alphaproteobacteria bacterium]|nr:glycine zipper family protein [Alphaproteobacteria bacterium]